MYFLLTIIVVASGVLLVNYNSTPSYNHGDGKILGPNPNNLPKEKVPPCKEGGAGGISDTPRPCFKPESTIYL